MTTIRSIRQTVATLSGGQRQSVAVARAVMWNSRLVILDEPTAALGVAQTEQVLALVNRLAEQGLGVVLISHNLHDIFETATGSPCCASAATPASSSARRRRRRRSCTRSPPAADEGLGDPRHRQGRPHDAPADRRSPERRGPAARAAARAARGTTSARATSGAGPVIIALAIVVLVFSQTAQNFFTPANFTNIITQMAGTCLLAYGVVFVLLIGEIDLSVGFVSGVAGVVVAKAQLPNGAAPALVRLRLARAPCSDGDRRLPGIVRRADRRAVVRRHARRLRDLAGRDPAGRCPGVIVIQDNTINNFYELLLQRRTAGWIIGGRRQRRLRRRDARGRALAAGGMASRSATRLLLVAKCVVVPAITLRHRLVS